MRGRDRFYKYRGAILGLAKGLKFFPLSFRKSLLNCIAGCPGTIAIALRYALLKSMARAIGDNVAVHRYCVLIAPENMTLGSNISIHPFCYLDATGGIQVANDVSIAHASTILSASHQFIDNRTPIKDQPVSMDAVQIASNVWIGCGVRILSGCKVEEGVVIAAGAVARGTLEANRVYGGVPVKIVKNRAE